MSDLWWHQTHGGQLAQGDLLPDCLLPVFIDPTPTEDDTPRDVPVLKQRLIIVTQSCDLAGNKVEFVALCPVHTLDEFADVNLEFKKRKNWNSVRKGNHFSLHMLASHQNPEDPDSYFVVDFGHIVSLPIEYVINHAQTTEKRWRLASPFLEHFSQSFARFFMRVGLPSSIPEFK